ncbi:hypothetical protein TorRG33x02_022590, partial [Trema orientale]
HNLSLPEFGIGKDQSVSRLLSLLLAHSFFFLLLSISARCREHEGLALKVSSLSLPPLKLYYQSFLLLTSTSSIQLYRPVPQLLDRYANYVIQSALEITEARSLNRSLTNPTFSFSIS